MSRVMTSLLKYHVSRGFLPLLARDAVAEPVANATAAASSAELMMRETHAVEIVERTMSSISILGSLFVLISFLTCPSLNQKSVNRLIFYASIGNMMSNVATLISVSGLKAGVTSGLCQTQGFLIQWYAEASFPLLMARLHAIARVFRIELTSSMQVHAGRLPLDILSCRQRLLDLSFNTVRH